MKRKRYRPNKKSNGIIDGLLNAQASVFEIKKILKNGFELYNLINEKTYTVSSLTKMTNFRGVYAGQYIVGRIFSLDRELDKFNSYSIKSIIFLLGLVFISLIL